MGFYKSNILEVLTNLYSMYEYALKGTSGGLGPRLDNSYLKADQPIEEHTDGSS